MLKSKGAVLQKSKFVNYYAVLGCPPGLTDSQLRDWYLELARRNHPDVSDSGDKFTAVTEAYAVLRDPAKRAVYDAQLRMLSVPCTTCDGRGLVRVSKGFLVRSENLCKRCGGTGQEREQ